MRKISTLVFCFALICMASSTAVFGWGCSVGSTAYNGDSHIWDSWRNDPYSYQPEILNFTLIAGTVSPVPGVAVNAEGDGVIAGEDFLAPDLPRWSLVGKVGDGAPFYIGKTGKIPIHDIGRIYLAFNDNNYQDNSGALWVEFYEEPVPEPSSILALGTLIAPLGFIYRRRKH